MARVCVIREFYFPHDTRVRREVGALVRRGHEVDVICMRAPGEPMRERAGRVRVRRIPLAHVRGGPARYAFEYLAFLLLASALSGALCLRRRYDVLQVNTLPDLLVFAALLPRTLGARVLIDLHECMPEFLATRFGLPLGHPMVRLLGWIEQGAIRFADRAITCTEQMRAAFVARGAPPEKLEVVLNSADEELFDARRHPPQPRQPGRFQLICHGSIEDRYGLDTVVRAVALLRGEIEGLELRIYGEGSAREPLRRLVSELALDGAVHFSDGFVPLDELLPAIAAADAGVVATRRDVFRDMIHTNKMFDLIAMRRPAVVSRTPAVTAYFDESCFAYFESGDARDLARAIRELHADPRLGQQRVERAAETAEAYRWTRQRERYLRVVEDLAR